LTQTFVESCVEVAHLSVLMSEIAIPRHSYLKVPWGYSMVNVAGKDQGQEVKAWVHQCNETTGSHTAVHSEMFVVFMKGYKMLYLPQRLHFYRSK